MSDLNVVQDGPRLVRAGVHIFNINAVVSLAWSKGSLFVNLHGGDHVRFRGPLADLVWDHMASRSVNFGGNISEDRDE